MSAHAIAAQSSPSSAAARPPSPQPALLHGSVKRVNAESAWGWIQCPSRQNDVFYHQSNVVDQQLLSEGDEVEFVVGFNNRKQLPQAEQIAVVRLRDEGMRGRKFRSRFGQQQQQHPQSVSASSVFASFSISAPPSPAYNAATAAEYIASLPRYGRVELVSPDQRSASLVTLPLLSSELPETLVFNPRTAFTASALTQLGPSSLVSFHQHPRESSAPSNFFLISPASLQSFPSSSVNRSGTFDSVLLVRLALLGDEDRHTEFKSLLSSHHVEERVSWLVEKNVCAYANSEGGWLYVGVDDSGVVEGLWLDKRKRDELKRRVDSVMHHMSPPIDTQLYHIDFLPVHLALDSAAAAAAASASSSSAVRVIALPELFVLVVQVLPPSPHSGQVYFTSGRLRDERGEIAKGKAWLRRDGSVREMDARMVSERMQNQRAERERQMKEEILKEVMTSISKQQQVQPAAAAASSSSLPPPHAVERKAEPEEASASVVLDAIVDQLLTMGVDKSQALDAVYQVARDARIKGVKRSQEAVISETLDRLNAAEQERLQRDRDRDSEEKYSSAHAAQPAQLYPRILPAPAPSSYYSSLPSTPAPASSALPPSPPSASSSSSSSSSLPSSSSLYPTMSFSFRPAQGQAAADAAECRIPCEFCPLSFPLDSLMEHQKQCGRLHRLAQRQRQQAQAAAAVDAPDAAAHS